MSKSETNPKSKIQMFKTNSKTKLTINISECPKQTKHFVLNFENSNFDIVSNFGFRVPDLS